MKKLSVFSILIIILLGGLIGGVAWYSYDTLLGPDSSLMGSSTYVAVFLTTNQVFFGKIESMDYENVVLSDTFYLQQGGSAESPEFILQKSGSELHSPEDIMFINRNHILIIQPLRSSSQVIQAIGQYKESLKTPAANQQAEAVVPDVADIVPEESEPEVLE